MPSRLSSSSPVRSPGASVARPSSRPALPWASTYPSPPPGNADLLTEEQAGPEVGRGPDLVASVVERLGVADGVRLGGVEQEVVNPPGRATDPVVERPAAIGLDQANGARSRPGEVHPAVVRVLAP